MTEKTKYYTDKYGNIHREDCLTYEYKKKIYKEASDIEKHLLIKDFIYMPKISNFITNIRNPTNSWYNNINDYK